MSLSIYQISVPVFIRMLGNLSAILAKAEAHAQARSIDPTVLLNARLAGVEIPSYADDEQSFADLQARIAKTVDYLKGFKPEQFEGAENRDIHIKTPSRELQFKGLDFLLGFANANFYFHVTTAYAILRHNGVELGKMDFLGGA